MISMNDLISKIECELIEKLRPDNLSIIDDTSKHTHHKGYQKGKIHITIQIKAKKLDSLSRIEKHRKIYGVLTEYTPYLHAIAIKFIQ